MLLFSLLLSLCLAVAVTAKAQNATGTYYVPPGVPTDAPIAASYNGPLRPQVHFSPPKGFMNDPNGMFVDADGLYHLYYQYNPNATIAGNQHWGHATSTDLYHWTNQKIAIFPVNSTALIFTGSCVVDANNTSGLFPSQTNGVLAYYTLATSTQQAQALAYSHDGGYTFTQYAHNPIIAVDSMNFRDPHVSWHAPTSKWVMVVSYATEFTLGIYTSSTGLSWTHASNFTPHGLVGHAYECPNLVQLPMTNSSTAEWLLWISINPGAPLGGSSSQYCPGTFNGTHFMPYDTVTRLADFAKDAYAAQFFNGIAPAHNQISITWASNWEYTDYVPTGPLEGWASAMSIARQHYLENITATGYDLVSAPYGLSSVLPPTPLTQNTSIENGTLVADFSQVASGAVYFEVNITSLGSGSTALSNTASVNFTLLSSVSGEMIQGGQFLSSGSNFWLDRGASSNLFESNPFFTNRFSTAPTYSTSYDMFAIVDRTVFEIYLMGGAQVGTMTFFPEYEMDTLIVKLGGLNSGARISAAVYGLESAWTSEENSNGTVMGEYVDGVEG